MSEPCFHEGVRGICATVPTTILIGPRVICVVAGMADALTFYQLLFSPLQHIGIVCHEMGSPPPI